jgi:thiamine-phosphate pyrophosphorylase
VLQSMALDHTRRFSAMFPFPARGLYAVTPEHLSGRTLSEAVSAALAGGARAVQYRDKSQGGKRRTADAAALVALCRRARVPLIVNDDVTLARAVGADGVHLGRDDPALEQAREILGPGAIIGVSCYDEVDRALAARAAGATYVAFGSFFPSTTKPGAIRATVDLVRRVRSMIEVPIVGIGGITPENAPALLEAGIDVLAVVNAVFNVGDARGGAKAFEALF